MGVSIHSILGEWNTPKGKLSIFLFSRIFVGSIRKQMFMSMSWKPTARTMLKIIKIFPWVDVVKKLIFVSYQII